MRHFARAKDRFNRFDAPYSNGSNIGPGFTVDDAFTMNHERARHNEARREANLDRWIMSKEQPTIGIIE